MIPMKIRLLTMAPRRGMFLLGFLVSLAAVHLFAAAPDAGEQEGWQLKHDKLVARLNLLAGKENTFGPAYAPLYHAALRWYEEWGGKPRHAVDDWMVPPEAYAGELADALEQGRNSFVENPGALWPLALEIPGTGRSFRANYWLTLPAGFGEPGRTFPLVIGLHGSGWLGHKISFVRKSGQEPSAGGVFSVTPINEGGPWQIDFLNAYLDELMRILPIDRDRIYVEGHSLGAMATWEWALDNPERFAAISPRSGIGEPFRAARLKHVPAWVIHGVNDEVVPAGFADQMVTALQASGASVRYSVLPDVGHNMPDDLDERRVVDWYLRQSRSHEPVPADPRDALGLSAEGFSPWEKLAVPAGRFWVSAPAPFSSREAQRAAALPLFRQAEDRQGLADALLQLKLDRQTNAVTLWLPVPQSLRSGAKVDLAAVARPAASCVRFYFRGETKLALAHVDRLTAEIEAAGLHPSGELWITPLSLWWDTASSIAEYRIGLK